jgi:tetratricopeptide (TPR) repeat protein
MKHPLENDLKYLKWHNQQGIAHFIRDYQWFVEKYLPAVHRLEKTGARKDRFLLSTCYYIIGDVYDLIDCPKAAIKAYQKSFKLDPTHSEALREMGNMYETIGQYNKAASLLKKSLKINPTDEFAITDKKYLCSGGTPLYRKKDICWHAREHLAQGKPTAALNVLRNKYTIDALRIKACAYGILDDKDAVLEQWSKIADAKELIEVTFSDWFYLIDVVRNSSEFWETISHCAKQNRFTYGCWYMFDSLYNSVVLFPSHRKRNSKADLKRCNKCNYLLAQYHIARIMRDLKLAGRLLKQYPKWIEIKTLHKKLSR